MGKVRSAVRHKYEYIVDLLGSYPEYGRGSLTGTDAWEKGGTATAGWCRSDSEVLMGMVIRLGARWRRSPGPASQSNGVRETTSNAEVPCHRSNAPTAACRGEEQSWRCCTAFRETTKRKHL